MTIAGKFHCFRAKWHFLHPHANGLAAIVLFIGIITGFISVPKNVYADSFEMYMERCAPYREMIESILEEEGISKDFFFLALAESGCRTDRTSIKGGAGLWQLMPRTARIFGLTVNKKIDERLDVEKSTRAAAKYIKHEMDKFSDFQWSIAAYNAGGKNLRDLTSWKKGTPFSVVKEASFPSWALAKTVLNFKKRDEKFEKEYGYKLTDKILNDAKNNINSGITLPNSNESLGEIAKNTDIIQDSLQVSDPDSQAENNETAQNLTADTLPSKVINDVHLLAKQNTGLIKKVASDKE